MPHELWNFANDTLCKKSGISSKSIAWVSFCAILFSVIFLILKSIITQTAGPMIWILTNFLQVAWLSLFCSVSNIPIANFLSDSFWFATLNLLALENFISWVLGNESIDIFTPDKIFSAYGFNSVNFVNFLLLAFSIIFLVMNPLSKTRWCLLVHNPYLDLK